jgi:UPF0042 nucleotide-binding protein
MGVVRTLEVLVVTGMSGAGRSTAARALEDLGWFVVDNLPPTLLSEAISSIAENSDHERVAVVVDVRGGPFFEMLSPAIDQVSTLPVAVNLLFLEASDGALVRRFESNRRPHPLQRGERLVDGLRRERVALSEVRGRADLVIDTSTMNVHDLRRRIEAAFGDPTPARLRATVLSFGFKYGIPVDADIVLDARFLPNPHWVPELQPLTGLDAAVHDYVIDADDAREFLDRAADLLRLVAAGYLREGKRFATIAIGCTGGKHRSVALTEDLAARLVLTGVEPFVVHRDLGRE